MTNNKKEFLTIRVKLNSTIIYLLKIIVLYLIFAMQTSCVSCLFPPTAETTLEVPQSMSTKTLFKIVQDSSIGTIYYDSPRRPIKPWLEQNTIFNIEDKTMEIGKIKSNSVGLKIRAERKDNGKKLVLYLGGNGPYCKDMLEPEKHILKLSEKIQETIINY